jgi:cytochrome c-type biogenesis protein
MTLLILAFIAGVLTTLAPCILPLLPVIVGGTIVRSTDRRNWLRPVIVSASLALSVIIFTLLLKASTTLLGIPQMFWQVFSGSIVALLGLSLLFPELWEKLPLAARFNASSGKLLGRSAQQKGLAGDILTGAALGPVFNSCSPTYAFIVAAVLPRSFFEGLGYLFAYAIGLGATLLLISFAGQALALKLGWLANPTGSFKRIIGVLFIAVGLSVAFGLDKKVQAFVLEKGWYDPIQKVEQFFE